MKKHGTGALVAVLALLLASAYAAATPRLQAFYDVATATRAELRRVNATNSSILGVRIGDTLEYLQHRLGRPHGVTIKDKGTPGEHRVLRYDDFDVRVDSDRRISRIRVMASGVWILRNGLRELLSDFSERRMRQLLGWNYRRKLKRVYVWPIDRRHFVQDQNYERLVKNVQQYYGFRTREEAEKKIIRAWDTTYVYSERGIRVRVYSNVPVSGRFKADFVLVKPVPSTPSPSHRPSPLPRARRQ